MYQDTCEQYEICLGKIEGMEKFERFIECSVGPPEFSKVRADIVQTVELNKEIKSNSRNNLKARQTVLDQYELYYPCQAVMKKSKFKSSCDFTDDIKRFERKVDILKIEL